MLTGYIIEKYSCMKGAYTCHRMIEEAKKRGISLQIVGVADTTITEEGVYHKGKRLEQCDFVINRYKYGHIKDEIGALAKRTYNKTDDFNIYINKYMQVENLRSEGFLMPKYMLGTAFTYFYVFVVFVLVCFVFL